MCLWPLVVRLYARYVLKGSSTWLKWAYPICGWSQAARLYQQLADMNARNSASVFHSNSVVCSHHVYKRIRSPFIGETLSLEWKPGNTCDQCTVCVKRGPDIFGHVPREISCIMSQFLAYNGNASCYRKSKFGVGLEVPCVCKFTGGGGLWRGWNQIEKKTFFHIKFMLVLIFLILL